MNEMNIQVLQGFIQNVGFPITFCLLIFWWMKSQMEKNAEQMENQHEQCLKQIQTLTDAHTIESKEMTTAINNNTLTMQKLIDKLGGMENGRE